MILVTGGTGLLGNCIVRELCSRQLPTRVLCRPTTTPQALEGLAVDVVYGDINAQGAIDQAVAGCSAVIHCAAQIHIGWQRLEESRLVNVEGTRRLVHACLTHSARLVHVSTVDTLPTATDVLHPVDEKTSEGIANVDCSYVRSKTEAERVVREAVARQGLDAVILHPGFMLAPYDWKPSSGRMMLEVHRAPLVVAPAGGCSLCDARDVARATVNSIQLGRCGEAYILAGDNLSYRQLWQEMLRTTGRQRQVLSLGAWISVFGHLLDAAYHWLPLREGDVNGAAIAMGMLNHYYCSAKAERELNYQRRPRTETLTDAWQWLSRKRE